MQEERFPFRWIIALAVTASILSAAPFFEYLFFDIGLSPTEDSIDRKLAKEAESFNQLTFNLVDPNQAPLSIKETVEKGYHIMTNTTKYAKDYAGDKLSCTNCHFSGGITTGGKYGSISLAGIASAYPEFNTRANRVITLAERINSCFERSMNGKALPFDSEEMTALLTYLQWISRNYPIYQPIPWRGLKKIESKHVPDPKHGETVYISQCALCHGPNGEGERLVPPLWGPESFNDGAGMHDIGVMASFVHQNMPYEEPTLSEEDSLDVAAYIREQPRPKFQKQ